ncbi:MAG: hypothetical protein ACI31C_05095, partial [Muribaculaceae bacterium]
MNTLTKVFATAMMAVCSLSLSASGVTTAGFAAAGVRNVSPQCSSSLQSIDNAELIDFVTTVMPGLSEDRDLLNYLMDYYKGYDYPVDPGDYQDIEAFVELLSMCSDQLAPYFERVLPLYLYLVRDRVTPKYADVSTFSVDTVYAAPVDEIFYGIGDERNHYEPYGLSQSAIDEGIAAGGRVKHNQSYLWGMVSVGDKVYWCTNTNYLCLGGA